MRLLKREFSNGELAAIVFLSILIAGMAYYLLVLQPVRSGIETAHTERDTLQSQITLLDAKLQQIQEMQQELEDIESGRKKKSQMPSYNAGKQELDFLNQALADTEDYYIGFSGLQREGDQIRRSFSLQFQSGDYSQAMEVIDRLENAEIRCLIGDLSVNPIGSGSGSDVMEGAVSVGCVGTFFETMYDGVADKELPEDGSVQ